MNSPAHIPFLIGRIAKDGRRLVLIAQVAAPFPGPWELKAVFAA